MKKILMKVHFSVDLE